MSSSPDVAFGQKQLWRQQPEVVMYSTAERVDEKSQLFYPWYGHGGLVIKCLSHCTVLSLLYMSCDLEYNYFRFGCRHICISGITDTSQNLDHDVTGQAVLENIAQSTEFLRNLCHNVWRNYFRFCSHLFEFQYKETSQTSEFNVMSK